MNQNKEGFKLLDDINNDLDLYYVSLIVLSSFKRKNYRKIPELALLLDEDNLLRLLEVYGGQTLNIPTKEEVLRYMKVVLIYYYINVQGLSNKEAIKKAQASGDKNIYNDVIRVFNVLENLKIPDMDKND